MAVYDGRNVELLIGFVELSLRRLQHPPEHSDGKETAGQAPFVI